MKVEIISRELIKPSFPTSPHLRLHQLSFFDQFIAPYFVPVVLFYPNREHNDHGPDFTTKQLHMLKKSLSETLVGYYPLAGRIRDRESIDCNDEGAVVLEAQTSCELSEILKHPNTENLNLLFPDDLQWTISDMNIPLLVQITFFCCGGITIGFCISHKVLDMSSTCTFVNNWAAIGRGSGEKVKVLPDFTAATMFPQGDLPRAEAHKLSAGNLVTRRFVFDASKIASLKAMATKNVQNPTRVEVVSSLIYKCAISASRTSSNSSNPTLFVQLLNLRKRMVPLLPENVMGNLVFVFSVLTRAESEIVLPDVVAQMREGLVKFCDKHAKNFRQKEWFSAISECLKDTKQGYFSSKNLQVYKCSSWCRMPLFEGDFGWGRPAWLTTTSDGMKNSIFLMDARDGKGIEALVTLEEQDMAVFERDDELLEFASLNPSTMEAAP